jgi:hypothetical protein
MDNESTKLPEWFLKIDLQSIAGFDDKLQECEFFFDLLSKETDRHKFRWLISAFLNAAYSFFETTALTAHFRFTDENGDARKDIDAINTLEKHVKVTPGGKKPFVKTSAMTTATKKFYDLRNKTTHRHGLSIMITGPDLPMDFHFGSIKGETEPAMPLCQELISLVKSVYLEIHS